MNKFAVLLSLAFALGTHLAHAVPPKPITSPEQAFGFKPGTDRKLADWKQLTAYYQTVASQSDRVRYTELGKTTEARPFVMLTVSSPDNLAHLADYQDIQRKLADPRSTTPAQAKGLTARGKTVMLITFNIHSTEIASSQTAAEFVYRLATENSPEVQSILDNVILLMVPSQNPDGEQLVVDWYKKYLGTPYEGSQPPVLWAHYVGHDDNRDWVGLTQVETAYTAQLINSWHPQILYDLHQMGANGPRIYLPPWVDPIDPNVDPLLVFSMNALGTRTAHEIASDGMSGVLVHGVYDFWSPLRDYISMHNGLRILTESASANIASPIDVPFQKLGSGIGYDAKKAAWNFPQPWPGGMWRLGDIVNYQMDALFSLAKSAALDREQFLSDFYTVSEHMVHPTSGPYAYVIPAHQVDPVVTARLLRTMRQAGVELQQATASFEVDGKSFPSGSYIIALDQPFRAFAKSTLEVQHYPDIRQYPGGPPQRPYDVTAHTLPLLFGVTAVSIDHKPAVSTRNVDTVPPVVGHLEHGSSPHGYILKDTTNSSLYALFYLLHSGVHAYRLTGPGYTPGTIFIPRQDNIAAKLSQAAHQFSVDITPAARVVSGSALAVTLPRIGLYQSWVPSMDEGWTRFIFDKNGIPYKRLVDAAIRKGNLNKEFDVIILPDNTSSAILDGHRGGEERSANLLKAPPMPPEYTGGLEPSGVSALRTFVQNGGTVITLNKASEIYALKDSPQVNNALYGIASKDFYCPGSILEVAVDTSNPVGFGSAPTVPVFFEMSPSFRVSGGAQSVAHYTGDKPLLSGWILGGEHLNGTSAIAEEQVGEGRVILFGFRPQYRALSEVTYKFLFNAILYSSSKPISIGRSNIPKGHSE